MVEQWLEQPLFFSPNFYEYITWEEIEANPSRIIEATKVVQADVLPLEHQTVITALDELAMGRGRSPRSRRHQLVPENEADTLYKARELAIKLFPQG